MKKTNVIRLAILGFLMNPCANLFAQPSLDLIKYQEQYKDADAVFLSNDRNVIVKYSGGKLDITQDQYEELVLLNTNVNRYSESFVGYSGMNDLIDLDAKTLVPEKNKYRTVAVRNIITEKSMDEGIFYDDYKSKKIFFSGLQPGAHRVVSYKQQIKMPQLLPPFFFQSYAPVERSTYTITLPNSVNIEYKLFNVAEDEVHFSVEEGSKEKVYKWEMKNVAGLHTLDDDAPGIRHFMPHIVVRLKDYSDGTISTNVLSGTKDLYKWYYGFVKNVNNTESAQLKVLVDSLTKNSGTDVEKIRQIYYWVQDHIRYVAFEDGLQGFIPREADSVCSKRYGDCKDMSSILTSMMKLAGLKAYPAWIGTRDIPYTYEQVPTPLTDNHMIAAVVYDGKTVFLDATSKHLAFGYPSSFIQGKEALIGIDSVNYKIETVAEVDYKKNTTVDSFHLRIDNRMLKGKASKHLTGYDKQWFTYFLGSLEKENFKKAMEARLTVGNNKFRLDTAIVLNQIERDKDLVVNSEFYLADYIQQVGDEIYVNLNLERMWYNNYLDTAKRKLDYEEEYKWLTTQHYELEIPEGYAVEYLPKEKSVDNERFGFDMSYTQSGNKIILDKTQYLNFLLLKKNNFSQWNAMIKEISKAYNESIILKKK